MFPGRETQIGQNGAGSLAIDRVTILGDGQMALVMADALAHRGVGVRLWGPFPDQLEKLAETRRSPDRLPGFVLPDAVEVMADAAAALDSIDLVLNAIPTQFIRSVWTRPGQGSRQGPPPEVWFLFSSGMLRICSQRFVETSSLKS